MLGDASWAVVALAMSGKKPQTTFINLTNPDEAKEQSETVRSHVTRYQWQRHAKKGIRSLAYRTRQTEQVVPVHIPPEGSAQPQGEGVIVTEYERIRGGRRITRDVPASAPSIFRILGGSRVDPFRSYPVAYWDFLPRLVDHCKYIHHSSGEVLTPTRPGQHGSSYSGT